MSNLSTPTADQLAAARLAHWRQNAEPIQTINMLRDWLNISGLVFYTPRVAQLPAPAPSFVEAILGQANSAPTLSQTESSRSLLARLVLDGGAIPLNLLGNPTGTGSETPDFIVSPLAFPYVFTLRGDKTWKQPPATSGASKVSPLALNTYNLLADQATGMSSYDLTTQLGKEVTETAVLRALTELWQHLRVLPVPQLDGAPTLWELTSSRFTKQIKAGANAGQPTALSALISLYLGQAIVASEEDIETFLSPVAPRSRIRDVVHALISARQLETIAVEGRTVLHVAGELPASLAVAAPAAISADDASSIPVIAPVSTEGANETPRISKFVPKPRKVGTGFVTKPSRSTDGSSASPRERRPFTRESNRPISEKDRPSFAKPWSEEKADRLAAASMPSIVPEDPEARPSSSYAAADPAGRKPSYDRAAKRPSFGAKPTFGSRPSFGGKSRPGDDRPSFRRNSEASESRPPRREFTPRPYSDAPAADFGSDRPRKTFSKPGTFGRKREGFAGKPSFSRDSDSRPPRRDFAPRRPEADSGEFRPPRRTFGDRPDRSSFGGARSSAPRSSYRPREGGAGPSRFAGKPSFSRDRDDRAPRSGGFGANRGPNGGPDRGAERGANRSDDRTGGPPFRKFDAPRTPRSTFAPSRPDRSARTERPERSGGYADKSAGFGAKKPFGKSAGGYAAKSSGGAYAGKSGASFAGKKPYGKSASGAPGKPVSTFDKFKGNKKPFGNRPPARKFKREEGE